MSDVAPASFFPTPLEIAGGIRWMRAHPVVATAAAATAAAAVSVLTYLKTRADDSEGKLLYAEGVEGSDASDYDDEEERDMVLSTLPRRNRVRRRLAAMSVVVGREDKLLPPTVDYHAHKLSEEICSSTDSDASSSPTRGRQSSFGELDVEEPTMLPSVLGGNRAAESEDTSASPQWGWYVSTTPPEDYYQ